MNELVAAMDAVSKAHRDIALIDARSDLTPRERKTALAEPLAQVDLGRRFLLEVLRRNGIKAEADHAEPVIDGRHRTRRRDPNWAMRVEARRVAELCDRCDCPAVPGQRLCRTHRRKQRAVKRRWAQQNRKRVEQGVEQAPTTTKFRTRIARGTEDRPRRSRSS